ncbi:rhodanese-like domain-containing protein [Silanimonas sp.]|uniref:rhodanese-like domain-containing protein n=1 Tax=Silanimonas sp. TaxID=1929290 RepID=UPI0022CAFD96|nr:rhodanese-like domain-containing protein [Silanimonas sp.]MCZ8166384.1 rhodanese-like domain-containing protein [Silanimonas sp.]
MLAMIRSLLGGPATSASVEEAASLMASGATLVDVREHSEWQSGHAKGAIHIPLGDLQSGGERALAAKGVNAGANDTLLLICHSGMRSGLACRTLGDDASFKAINVKGGMIAWQRAGLPMGGGR